MSATMDLRLRFLGEIEVERGGTRLGLPPSRKTRALLAYLVVTGRPHRRDRLCSLFWDVPDDPRGALRWSLSRLRGLVDEPGRPRILADRESVRFDPAGAYVDLLAMRERVGPAPEAASTSDLAEAAAAFRGEFLEGFDLKDCPEFEAWCLAERQEARALHAQVLTALTEHLALRPDEALPYARSLVRLDPYSEPARALLVRLLGAAGRHREAEEQYEASRRVLREAGGSSGALGRAWREVRAGAAPAPVEPPGDARDDPGPAPGAGPAPTAESSILRQEIRFCVASDGVRIAYATVGRGPALLKPANWMTHLEYDWQSPVWRHWIRELARDRCLVRYDERANGLSDWHVADLSFDTFVRDLEAVVEATGLDRFAMLGISQGCAIASAYTVRHPERVSRLVLYGGYARGWAIRGSPDQVAWRKALSTLMKHGWAQDNPAFRQVFTSLFIPEATVEQMQWFNDLLRMTTSPENALHLHNAFGRVDVRALLPQVHVPTLVLHCRNDGVVPFEEGRLLATSIPCARFVPLEGRNHILLETEPAWGRFLAEVRAFLAPDEP